MRGRDFTRKRRRRIFSWQELQNCILSIQNFVNFLTLQKSCLEFNNGQHTSNRWCCAKRSITNCSGERPAR